MEVSSRVERSRSWILHFFAGAGVSFFDKKTEPECNFVISEICEVR